MKTGRSKRFQSTTILSIHSFSGMTFPFRLPVSAPMMTQSGRGFLLSHVLNDFRIGSILRKVCRLLFQRNGASGVVTVVPNQRLSPFGSRSLTIRSMYLCGFLVRNRYLCCGAAAQASKTALIHSSGTHVPKRSDMEQTKIVLCFFHFSGT